ncbi:MAG: class I SAM-dependent methyltransferase [Planctomycetota bacterium]
MTTFQNVPIDAVRDYWNRRPCNLRHSQAPVGTRAYFDQGAERKYFVEPHIPRFAQFERWGGKRVLEVGCGIGADTVSFARAGADLTAVDLSEASLELTRKRLSVYGLSDRVRTVHANAERLGDTLDAEPFDLVYSFGVLHHTPDPGAALRQLRGLLKPGGELRIMLYHRYCTKVLGILCGRRGLGRVWKLDRLIAEHSEAQTGCPVTYAYGRRSAKRLVESAGFRVKRVEVDHVFPYRVADYREHRYVKAMPFRALPGPAMRALERRFGWHLCVTAEG